MREGEYWVDVDLDDAESLKMYYITAKERNPDLSPDEIFEVLSIFVDQKLEEQFDDEERKIFIEEMKEKVLIG